MKIKFIIVSILTVITCTVSAAPIHLRVYSGIGQPLLVDANGDPVQDAVIALGTFRTGFDPLAHADDPSALKAAFMPIAFDRVRPIFGEAGHFSLVVNNTSPIHAGRQLWLFTVCGDQFGLFTSGGWVLPGVSQWHPLQPTWLHTGQVSLSVGSITLQFKEN